MRDILASGTFVIRTNSTSVTHDEDFGMAEMHISEGFALTLELESNRVEEAEDESGGCLSCDKQVAGHKRP